MQVRAKDIVKKAHQSGNLPPDPFPMDQLSGVARKSNLQELQDLLNLQHMMQCMEYMLLYWEKRPSTDFSYPPEFVDLIYLTIGRVWKEYFYRSKVCTGWSLQERWLLEPTTSRSS